MYEIQTIIVESNTEYIFWWIRSFVRLQFVCFGIKYVNDYFIIPFFHYFFYFWILVLSNIPMAVSFYFLL